MKTEPRIPLPPGGILTVRVTPNASRERLEVAADGVIRIYVTVVPEDGKANAAAKALLANACGVSKSRVELLTGDTRREKRFRIH